MNWRRGLHRVFLVACALWVLAVLVVFPFVEVGRARDFAAQSDVMSSSSALTSPESQIDRQRKLNRERSQTVLWQQATVSHFYRHEMLGHWFLLLVVLLVPPTLIYGLARAVLAASSWVATGFRS